MKLTDLVSIASNKENFTSIQNYLDFAASFLEFLPYGVQATIVSQNENNYRFFQYQKDGHFNISRPINADLMYGVEEVDRVTDRFLFLIDSAQDIPKDDVESRKCLCRAIYTIQQSIGAALDALPSGESNRARKVNGDLFERLILLLIQRLGISCRGGNVQLPVIVNDKVEFKMNYQHDLVVESGELIKAIGSVKTSSKDRIDKIFLDKFLYNRITGGDTPHFAVFLNDVQRKKTKVENEYGVSSTFLPGHFKGYTVKLNPLDGVFYCDIRPNMLEDPFLNERITTIDELFCTSLWEMVK
jgi:hypothetical protein